MNFMISGDPANRQVGAMDNCQQCAPFQKDSQFVIWPNGICCCAR